MQHQRESTNELFPVRLAKKTRGSAQDGFYFGPFRSHGYGSIGTKKTQDMIV